MAGWKEQIILHNMEKIIRPSRFSGADWATELKEIMLIGIGGIGSWLSLSLSRIGHELYLIDGDSVDETNVNGGQLYRTEDIGKKKVVAVAEICRSFGCINQITCIGEMYSPTTHDSLPIVISGLDNMKTRKEVFEAWLKQRNELSIDYKEGDEFTGSSNFLLIDGRLLMETAEVFCIQGNNEEQIKEYKEKWLFDDSDVAELECTTKQSTFAAMGIAGMITATLCNWLTNRKLDIDFREVPFHQRMYYPALDFKKQEIDGNSSSNSKEDKEEETSSRILSC